MPRSNGENWYAEKRAMAYVYSRFAMHDEARLTEVGEGKEKGYGVDLLIDLSEQKKWTMPRRFAVQVKGYRELPNETELNKQMSNDPVHRFAEEFEMPVIACVVQFANLEAVYSWIVEPVVEHGKAGLRLPDEYLWAEFQEEGVKSVLKKVAAFYEALYDVEIKKNRK